MGRKVKKKISVGLIIFLSVVVLLIAGAITLVIIDSNYRNRPDTYDYYASNYEKVDKLTSAIRSTAAAKDIKNMLIYCDDAASEYTVGMAKVSVEYATGDEKYDVFSAYADLFDNETAGMIKSMFFNSTAVIIKLSRDMTTNTYRIDYIENVHKNTNTNMILSYVSRQIGDEKAVRDYFGVINDRDAQLCYQVYEQLNENYYYVSDTLGNTVYTPFL